MKTYQAELTRLEEETYTKRDAICFRIRKEILLPFCIKHDLELEFGFITRFIEKDGNHLDTDDIVDRVGDTPEVREVLECLRIECMGYAIFDLNDKLNITEDHLKEVQPCHTQSSSS